MEKPCLGAGDGQRSRRILSDQIPPIFLAFSGCIIARSHNPSCGTSTSLGVVPGARNLQCAVIWPVASKGRDWPAQANNCPAAGGAVARLSALPGSGS